MKWKTQVQRQRGSSRAMRSAASDLRRRGLWPRARRSRAIGIDPELLGERASLGELDRDVAKIASAIAFADEATDTRAQDANAVKQDQAMRRVGAARASWINGNGRPRLHGAGKLSLPGSGQ